MSTTFIHHDESRFAATELDAGRHVMLIGPQGSGKTFFARDYAAQRLAAQGLQCPDPNAPPNLDIIDCDAHLEVDDILGTTHVDGLGGFEFVDGALTRAAKLGHILLINEFSVLKASIQHVFHAAANGEPLMVRTKGGHERVTLHPDFRIIATTNGDLYAGNYRSSLATLDRFTLIRWPYISADDEIGSLHEISPEHAPLFKELVKLAERTRAAGTLPPISTRALHAIAQMLKSGVSVERAIAAKLYTPLLCTSPESLDAFLNLVQGGIPKERINHALAVSYVKR